MIVVGNSIVSDDIADCRFKCSLDHCQGMCCIEGDSGAPLLQSEVPIMQAMLDDVRPYMTPEGLSVVAQKGVAVQDADGDLGTPLCADGACAFVTYSATGQAMCAIESMQRHRYPDAPMRTDIFLKPISCHLYPIRVDDYGEFTALNYHRWDICRCACNHGDPLYISLKIPLQRRFGKEWYDELTSEISKRTNQ